MKTWKSSTVDTFYASDEAADLGHPCEVRIGDQQIVVSYEGESGFVVYRGFEVGEGHFRLEALAVRGKATLHQFQDDDVLEGWWIEDGYEGMWRITLDE